MPKPALVTRIGRICKGCGEEKVLSEFYDDKKVKLDGKQATCKKCILQKSKNYVKSLPEGVFRARRQKYNGDYSLNANYKRFYGLSIEIVRKMFDQQNGRCANLECYQEVSFGGKDRKKRANLDHNHETGKVRGLVCNSCNMYLGVMENKKKFLGLRDYLKKYDTVPEYIKEC